MKNNIEALTLLESENSEVPNIGTVTVGWNKRDLVEQKIKNAIEAHFDCEIAEAITVDWQTLEDYNDTELTVSLNDDGNEYQATILIQRTTLY